jgi:ABC-2 type transport system permease protein
MTDILRAELRKLRTVRSTYIVSILALVIIALVAFYVEGWRGLSGSPASQLTGGALGEIIINTVSTSAIFVSIIAILFMAHEYRYNTIMYTLTAANSRTKVLLAKIMVIAGFTGVFTVIAAIVGVASYMLGLSVRDAELPVQTISIWSVLGRVLFYCVANALAGLLFAALLRNIVAAVAVFFIGTSTVEPLLGIVLKEKAAYLPFMSLQQVVTPGIVEGATMSAGKAALIFTCYLIIGWVITWWLFLRRDAN